MSKEIPLPEPLSNHQGIPRPSGASLDVESSGWVVVRKGHPHLIFEGKPPVDRSPQDTVNYLQTLAQRGPVIDADPVHAGRHGTSLESVIHVIKHGVLPGRTAITSEEYPVGEVHFYPTRSFLPTAAQYLSPAGIERASDLPRIELSLKNYANGLAQEHAIMKAFGYPLDDSEALSAAYKAAGDDDYHYFITHGFTGDQAEEVANIAVRRRGFMLGISKDYLAKAEFPLATGDPDEGDIRIQTGAYGLPIQALSGLQACGPEEEAFLADLQTRDPQEVISKWDNIRR